MNILSLFDGMSCGHIALDRAKIKVDNYFASEIKAFAIDLVKRQYPNTIHLGDVTKIHYRYGKVNNKNGEEVEDYYLETINGNIHCGKIDMLIGGSPCQDFSTARAFSGQDKYGLDGDKSRLFYCFLEILKEIQSFHEVFFLLENVKMKKDSEKMLNEYMGVDGLHINSCLVSYQHRDRIYWTNIPNVEIPKDRNLNFQYYIDKDEKRLKESKLNKTKSREKMWDNGEHKHAFSCYNITNDTKVHCVTRKQDRCPNSGLIEFEDFCRFLTRREIEGAQTVPYGYTDSLSYLQMQDVCGDGWTVDTIAHIFSFLPDKYKTNEISDEEIAFKELETILNNNNVDKNTYSLYETKDNSICIERYSSGYLIYENKEQRTNIKLNYDLVSACYDIIERTIKDEKNIIKAKEKINEVLTKIA